MLLGILSVAVGVLIVTGIALFFLYRPTTRQSWPGLLTESYDWDVRVSSALRLIHRLAAWLAVLTAIATGVALAIRRPATASRLTGPVLGAGIPITTLAAFFTGLLLPGTNWRSGPSRSAPTSGATGSCSIPGCARSVAMLLALSYRKHVPHW